MFRTAILAGALAVSVPSVIRAQQATTPPVPEDALTPRELIAWSTLQTPQPVQQQLPPQTQSDHSSEYRDSVHRSQQQNDPQPQEPARSQPAPRGQERSKN